MTRIQMSIKEARTQALIKWLESESGEPLDTSQKAIVKDIAYWSSITPKQCYQWVGDTMRLAESLAAGSKSRDQEALFWIRLHGIVIEVQSYLEKFQEFARGADGGNFARIRAVAALFSADEIFYIEYQRHCQSHMSPSLLRVRKHKAGTIGTTYKGRDIYELKSMIETTLKSYAEKHGIPVPEADRAIARDFAQRAQRELRSAYEAMSHWIR